MSDNAQVRKRDSKQHQQRWVTCAHTQQKHPMGRPYVYIVCYQRMAILSSRGEKIIVDHSHKNTRVWIHVETSCHWDKNFILIFFHCHLQKQQTLGFNCFLLSLLYQCNTNKEKNHLNTLKYIDIIPALGVYSNIKISHCVIFRRETDAPD